MIKRLAVCLLTIALMLCLASCGGDKDIDLKALGQDLANSTAFSVDMNQFAAADGIAAGVYRFSADEAESSVMYYSGSTGEEMLLAKAKDANAASHLEELCRTRVSDQQSVLQSYVPEAIPRLQNAIIAKSGSYVIFVVANDAAAAQSVVDKYLK